MIRSPRPSGVFDIRSQGMRVCRPPPGICASTGAVHTAPPGTAPGGARTAGSVRARARGRRRPRPAPAPRSDRQETASSRLAKPPRASPRPLRVVVSTPSVRRSRAVGHDRHMHPVLHLDHDRPPGHGDPRHPHPAHGEVRGPHRCRTPAPHAADHHHTPVRAGASERAISDSITGQEDVEEQNGPTRTVLFLARPAREPLRAKSPDLPRRVATEQKSSPPPPPRRSFDPPANLCSTPTPDKTLNRITRRALGREACRLRVGASGGGPAAPPDIDTPGPTRPSVIPVL